MLRITGIYTALVHNLRIQLLNTTLELVNLIETGLCIVALFLVWLKLAMGLWLTCLLHKTKVRLIGEASANHLIFDQRCAQKVEQVQIAQRPFEAILKTLFLRMTSQHGIVVAMVRLISSHHVAQNQIALAFLATKRRSVMRQEACFQLEGL